MAAERLPLASRIPVSMASLLRSDSVKPLRNSSSCQRANIEKQSFRAELNQTYILFFFLHLSWNNMVMNSETCQVLCDAVKMPLAKDKPF